MFDLGMQELVVIFIVALLVFGPKKLPELARTMGKGIGQLKKAMTDIKTEVDKEVQAVDDQVKHDAPDGKSVGEPGGEQEREPSDVEKSEAHGSDVTGGPAGDAEREHGPRSEDAEDTGEDRGQRGGAGE
jgi:Tat protein translocase TatB subunit